MFSYAGKSNLLQKIFIIVAIASGSIILTISIIIVIYFKRKHFLEDKKIEEMIRSYSTHTPKQYSYSQLKKITNSFMDKLGQGGFSTVYKGKLQDGQDVAVKLLKESRENGQDLMNEVVSVTKTSHVNIATLLGFCYERSKRALVYEYMSKGSLDKYIFQRRRQALHCRCNTRIVHFDIKPDNILLDNNFCPKISDFGLAKQCRAKESHVSMTGMKGTVGFMAPEVIFRNLGKVSHKSDVYSYGMLVLEMLGERKYPNEGMGQSSEEYFPDWIYNKLIQHEIGEGSYSWGDTKEEEEMARKMIIVGLHCIQTLPDNRPSMTNVVAMLEGSVDVLQIPPKPNLFGPPATDLLQGVAASSSSNSEDCGESYNCGELVNIRYPFWGNKKERVCGQQEFKLNCKNNQTTTVYINSLEYNVLRINQSNNRMRIARSDLFENYCPENEIQVATMNGHRFVYSSNNQNISVWYNCTTDNEIQIPDTYKFWCGGKWEKLRRPNYAFEPSAKSWSLERGECGMNIEVMVTREGLKEGIKERKSLVEKAVKWGFDVEYENWYKDACNECNENGGKCGGNNTYPYYCICTNGIASSYDCKAPLLPLLPPPAPNIIRSNDTWKKIMIGVGSGLGGIVIMSLIFLIRNHLNKTKHPHASSSILLPNNSRDRLMKALDQHGENSMAVPLFSYQELVRATDKFNTTNELGDGGFGTVYYGKLRDGREVAVKRLFQNSYRKVEHFMNEVEILTRLRHPHLVILYGCASRHCRELLLVYEFVPNGTVADHLHGIQARPGELPWLTRLKIAIETASALAFLHASETIHRDVKTTNILVDNNFNVKVADFGLSRLFPTQVTHVSTSPQGSPGYVDPEYQECYQLTKKSDVFSFGVVLVELISSKPAVDITRHRHEINLSTMAINKIQNGELDDFVDPCLGFKTDERIRDMICRVAELAFQCLQSVRDTRPSMLETLQILKNIENRS
ncbi:hypothetical protein IC582_029911 [Cucumis melo]